MLGMPDMSANDMVDKLEGTLPIIRSVNESFKDPVSHIDIVICYCRLYL